MFIRDLSLLYCKNIDLEKGLITNLVRKSRLTYEIPLSDKLCAHILSDMKPRKPLFSYLYATKKR